MRDSTLEIALGVGVVISLIIVMVLLVFVRKHRLNMMYANYLQPNPDYEVSSVGNAYSVFIAIFNFWITFSNKKIYQLAIHRLLRFLYYHFQSN